MPEVHFHHKDKTASRTIRVTGLNQLRQLVLEMRREIKRGRTCPECGQQVSLTENHICPDIIDAKFVDDTPLLPEGDKNL